MRIGIYNIQNKIQRKTKCFLHATRGLRLGGVLEDLLAGDHKKKQRPVPTWLVYCLNVFTFCSPSRLVFNSYPWNEGVSVQVLPHLPLQDEEDEKIEKELAPLVEKAHPLCQTWNKTSKLLRLVLLFRLLSLL